MPTISMFFGFTVQMYECGDSEIRPVLFEPEIC